MPKTIPLIAALLIVAVVILIGTVLLRGSAPLPAGRSPATATTEPDAGLARAMTFTTSAEPKK